MTMRAITVSHFGGPEAIEITEHPIPEPGPGQVRVSVGAAALNPVDAAMRAGVFGGELPIGLGWDVAGTIDATGPGVTWSPGERVISLVPGHHKPLGTHADYVLVEADTLAPAPGTLDDTQASALPLNATSAFQALRLLNLRPGQHLLVTGASGGVGTHAVELGHHQGLVVTGLGSASAEEFILSRGADHVLGRDQTPEPSSVDGVIDTAGLGGTALAAVRDAGSYVGMWPGNEPTTERGIRVQALRVHADGALLTELSHHADQGILLPRIARTYPLDAAAEAHARLAEGGLPGRIVLIP